MNASQQVAMYALVMVALGVSAYLGWSAVQSVRSKTRAFVDATTKYKQIAEKLDYVIHYDKLTHWQREKWEFDTFFHTSEAISGCQSVSSRDPKELRSWIRQNGDVNLVGDHGITLLFWALLDRNIKAFELLLMHGADPDLALTGNIQRTNQRPLFRGDTVMFAAIELLEFDFLQAAIPYSNSPDQRDYNGGNLLSRIARFPFFYSVRCSLLAELIRAGADPNCWLEDDIIGSVPAATMVAFDRPVLAYAMIIAGADPTFGSFADASVVDCVESKRKRQLDVIDTPGFQRLEHWLVENNFIKARKNVSP
ncbi:ankyrin repeat domain-containing protein [Allorhodopirellula solitaria]|uniref:ankyrin repeat domain-containing protein n=1 Tax=Allorhodopirellula solitaria TaxID=2527987 RepID=UPI0011B3607C|nr:ankyrin repeat domain-containing protein [Allorhodopirellula solitaria]